MIKRMLCAIDADQLEEVKRLVSQGQSIDEADETGTFPLFKAIAKEKLTIARYLLERGANVLQVHPMGSTLLMRACVNDSLDAVQLLLDYHAATLPRVQVGPDQSTPLKVALKHEQLALVRTLLAQPFDPLDELYTPHFVYLSHNRCMAFFETLIDCPNRDTREPTILSTTLVTAASCNDLKLIDLLLEHGVNINFSLPENKQTALLMACAYGHIQAVRHLYDKGADIELANSKKFSPLMVSLYNMHPKIVDFLLENRADVNAKGSSSLSPLSMLEEMDRKPHRILEAYNRRDNQPPMTLEQYRKNLSLFVRRILDFGGQFKDLANFNYEDTPAQQLIRAERLLKTRGVDADDIHSRLEAYVAERALVLNDANIKRHLAGYMRKYLGPRNQDLTPYVWQRLLSMGTCLERVHCLGMFMKSPEAKKLSFDTIYEIFSYLELEGRLKSCPLQPMPKQPGIYFRYQLSPNPKSFLDRPTPTDRVMHAIEPYKNLNLG